MKKCLLTDCNKRVLARGLCQRHYDQERRLLNPYRSEYETWTAMKNRCSPRAGEMYGYYYGRGIRVCERWINSFGNFLEDMGKKPTPKHTLDRIDNDGDYKPTNCKWATRQEQALNRRVHNLNKSGIVGLHYLEPTDKWRARIKVAGRSIWLGTFDTKNEALKARKRAEAERDKDV